MDSMLLGTALVSFVTSIVTFFAQRNRLAKAMTIVVESIDHDVTESAPLRSEDLAAYAKSRQTNGWKIVGSQKTNSFQAEYAPQEAALSKSLSLS